MGSVAIVLTGQLLLLIALLLPLGDLIREVGQWALRLSFPLPLIERILLDLYLAGGVLSPPSVPRDSYIWWIIDLRCIRRRNRWLGSSAVATKRTRFLLRVVALP